jgi:hypothetical protein
MLDPRFDGSGNASVQPFGPELTAEGVFSVQDRTQPLIPLNPEHSKRLLIAIPNQNCLTHLVKQSTCKELKA